MPTINEIPGAYERVRSQAEALAAQLGIQKEAIFGYFNETGHFPQTLGELEAWGNRMTKYGVSRRDPATGAWRPIMPGVNPDPRLSALDRGGFPHNITNAEDADIQRFQQVDPSGNVWGGSWDPAYNQANAARLAGTTGFRTAQAGLAPPATSARGAAGTMSAESARTMDQNNYVGPAPNGQYVSVVDGVPVYRNSQAEAEQDYNSRTAGADAGGAAPGAGAPAGSSGAGAGGGQSPAGGGGVVPGNVGANPATFGPAVDLANNASNQEYLRKRLELERDISLRLDEREKERIALESARDVWKQTYDRAVLTGRLDGAPTQDAIGKRAEITGYYDEGGTGHGQAVLDAVQALRGNAQYQAADGATRRAMEAAAVVQATGGAVSGEQAAQAVDRLRSMTAATGGMSSAQLVEGVLNQVAPGRATFGREKQQDQTALDALRLLSTLRGPENAFAYANTLANLPPSIRANIQASMARLPMAPRNPAAAGLFGDVGAQPGVAERARQAIGPASGPFNPYAPLGSQDAPATPPAVLAAPAGANQYLPAPLGPARQPTGPLVLNPTGSIGHDPTQPAVLQGGGAVGTAGSTNQYLPAPQAIGPAGQAAQGAYQAAAGSPAPASGPDGVARPAASSPQDLLRTAFPGAGTGSPLGTEPASGVWSDASRGNPQPGMSYAQVITPAGAPTAYGPRTQPASGEPFNPGQLSPTDMLRTDPYARKLMWAGFENAGGDIESGQWRYAQSLPRAYGPRTGRMRAA
jgi:hypothetical protein